MPWLNLIGAGLVAAAGSSTASMSYRFPPRGILFVPEFVAKARSDGMRGVVVVPFTPSDPRWPALAAASLTSVVGQRDPCIILPDPSAYVRVGDDLGGAQRLAVMAVDFGRWGKRSSVGFAPPCGGHAKLRQRQPLQSELYAADRHRLAAALLRLGRPGSGRKRAREDRGE